MFSGDITGSHLGQITSGKRVGTQNRKRTNRDIKLKDSIWEILTPYVKSN